MSHVDPLTGLVAVQAAIKSTLQGMTLRGKAVKIYDYDPGMPDEMPAVYMSMPDLVFPEIDSHQRQMGTYDVEFLWPVTIMVNANSNQLQSAHETMLILMAALTGAIENNQTLDLTAEDCRVVSMVPTFVFDVNGTNAKMICECHLHGVYFIDQ